MKAVLVTGRDKHCQGMWDRETDSVQGVRRGFSEEGTLGLKSEG